ncbi:hypothetical protein OAG63_01230 [Methylacidiphilales bacterium]|nr:hypothetical protein [Candidatus Methylacidiphilales bacterium]
MATLSLPICALEKPTGQPLELSSIETEQAVPLAIVSPDGKTVSCVTIRLHWNPKADVGQDDDATSFTLDIGADSPGASIFTAQLWSASLASSEAWQQPWQGARWKILQTPATDGSGIEAPLAVGMIATSARRPYPKETLVIGSLNPDGSLGPVSRLSERLDAAAASGISRVIIPNVQRFDTDASGEVVNIVKHASDLHLECVPVDNLVEATEATMNDPLPDITLDSSAPKYSNDVATYIDGFAHREQDEAASGLQFAPKEAELSKYPPRTAAIWKSVYADNDAAQQAYRAGQVYVAYQLFARANGRMHGLNALVGQNKTTFNVKNALGDADDLRQQLHDLMTPPSIDKAELESAVLVAEMADWAYDINATLEDAQLVTKQAFSQRSDATESQRDRAREMILFANEQCKYLLNQADFYTGLLAHVGNNNPIPVDENAAHLLPQLIPAQLATAQIFTEGIRQRANDLRDGLLFDPRLAAYMRVLRETKAAWDDRQRKKQIESAQAAETPASAANGPVKIDATTTAPVGFDPGNTYAPPHTALVPTAPVKKLSDAALCLIWANDDCEIATLDEKYLRLSGVIDPVTHEWQMKDRAKLDELLESAELGARRGIAFAEKVEVDPSVLAMIYEKAAHLRIQGDDASALDALRNYWRCALLGNMCWQLAHARKAEAVDLADKDKSDKNDDKKPDDKQPAKQDDKPKTSNETASTGDKDKDKEKTSATTNSSPSNEAAKSSSPAPVNPAVIVTPSGTAQPDNTPSAPPPPPAAPAIADTKPAPSVAPAAPPSTNSEATVPAAPATSSPNTNSEANVPAAPTASPPDTNSEANIPVAPIAKPGDYTAGDTDTNAPPATNAAPVTNAAPPTKPPPSTDGTFP